MAREQADSDAPAAYDLEELPGRPGVVLAECEGGRDRRNDAAKRVHGGWRDAPRADALIVEPLPNHIVVVRGLGTIDPGKEFPGRVEFRVAGKYSANCDTVEIIELSGTAIDNTLGSQGAGTYEFSNMLVKIETEQGLDFITNGERPDFVSFQELFPQGVRRLMGAIVPASEILNLTFKVDDNAPNPLLPRLSFICRMGPTRR